MPTHTPHKPRRSSEQPAPTRGHRRGEGAADARPASAPRLGVDLTRVRVGDDAAVASHGLTALPAVRDAGASLVQRQERPEGEQAEATRAEKIAAYDAAVATGDWREVAVRLNGFNDADIARLLRQLRREQGDATVREVYSAALQHMPGWSERVHGPIERLLRIESATGYVGLNPQAGVEAEALERQAPGQVITSLDDQSAEAALGDPQGRAAFVRGLGLVAGSGQYQNALRCLEECDAQFVDQMSHMMRMFRNSELGQYRLERLVLSGHHAGGRMWGDSDVQHAPGDLIPGRDVTNLARAFPGAAAQVQDVMLSACNSTNEVEVLQAAFPNLNSIWAYEGDSPRVDQGSAGHIRKWERSTRGRRKPGRRDRVGAAAVWTRRRGMLVKL